MKQFILLMATVLAVFFLSACNGDIDAYKDLVSIKGEADKPELYLGQSTNLKVIAHYTDGSLKDITSECSFELSNSNSKHISLNGSKVKAIGAEEYTATHEAVFFYYKKNVGSILLTILPTNPQ